MNPDITALIMSYSDDRVISYLMTQGAEYSTRTLQSPLFQHSRVETLLGRRVPYSADVDWKEVYYILKRALEQHPPPLYNKEDNATAFQILYDMGARPPSDSDDLDEWVAEIGQDGASNIMSVILSSDEPEFSDLARDRVDVLLATAVSYGRLATVKLLLEDERTRTYDQDLLWQAASTVNLDVPTSDYVEIVRLLLKRPDVDPTLGNILSAASRHGYNYEIVRVLLEDGRANPMKDDGQALFSAVEHGREKNLALLLADSRVDPTVGDGALLTHAVNHRQAACVRLLLKDGRVDPNSQGGAALISAIQGGQTEIAILLLSDERTDTSRDDNSALTEAIQASDAEVVDKLLDNPSVFEELSQDDLLLAQEVGELEVISLVRDALDQR